jgi:hypothetical protein
MGFLKKHRRRNGKERTTPRRTMGRRVKGDYGGSKPRVTMSHSAIRKTMSEQPAAPESHQSAVLDSTAAPISAQDAAQVNSLETLTLANTIAWVFEHTLRAPAEEDWNGTDGTNAQIRNMLKLPANHAPVIARIMAVVVECKRSGTRVSTKLKAGDWIVGADGSEFCAVKFRARLSDV